MIWILFLPWNTVAQMNLVPNPSFEIYTSCPDNISGIGDDQVARAIGWSTFSETPDYFNSCATNVDVTTPNNLMGFQMPHSGVAYSGIITYEVIGFYREIIGRQLSAPLQIGQKYFISFFVSPAGNPGVSMATNNLGIKFSTTPFDYLNPIPINNSSHINYSNIASDTSNWVLVSGSYVADSNYSYVAIGNFYDDSNTDTMAINAFPFDGYYFVDDVCVSLDSTYAATWTGLQENDFGKSLTIFPNPFESYIFINTSNFILDKLSEITVTNIMGQVVYKTSLQSAMNRIEFSPNPGIYLLEVRISEFTFNKLIIKN